MPAMRSFGARHLAIQRVQVDAGPEARLEILRGGERFVQDAPLVDDDRPRRDRAEQQEREDQLHEGARIENQPDDR
jgi:hypothetical protein